MAKKVTKYKPSAAERRLAQVMMNPNHRLKSTTDKCELANISRTTYYRCMDKPEFVTYYEEECMKMIKSEMGPILNSYLKKALNGSYQHGNVLLEMIGAYKKKDGEGGSNVPVVNIYNDLPGGDKDA